MIKECIKTFQLTLVACGTILVAWLFNTLVETPMPEYPMAILGIIYIFIALGIDIFRAPRD